MVLLFYINDAWLKPLLPKHKFYALMPLCKETHDAVRLESVFGVFNPEERVQIVKLPALWGELVARLRELGIEAPGGYTGSERWLATLIECMTTKDLIRARQLGPSESSED